MIPTITVMLKGGLGNQMFQYALGAELAYRNNLPLRIDCSQLRGRGRWSQGTVRELALRDLRVDFAEPTPKELEYLGARHYNSFDKRLLRRARSLFRKKPFPRKASSSQRITVETNFEYNPRVLTDYPEGQYLDGYWQSPRYFSQVSHSLRERFKPRRPPGRNTSELLEEIKDEKAICLMVRRGEYARDRSVRKFHGLMGKVYYENAAKALFEELESPTCYVFSDDIPWCKTNLSLPVCTQYVSHEHAGPHYTHYLQLMSACSAFVIPNSTFGWWAAWLANVPGDRIIAPRNWFAEVNVVTTDLIPAGWRRH